MKTVAYKFTISDVIDTYKEKLGSKDHTTAIYQPVQKACFRKDKNGNKIECGKNLFINLDALITSLINENDAKNGFVIANSDHTTSSVYINHFEKGMLDDLYTYLNKEFPFSPKKYKHNIWDHEYVNGAAHLKSMTMGKSATALIVDGKLYLGKFEDVIYAEFDYRADKTFTIALFWEENMEDPAGVKNEQ